MPGSPPPRRRRPAPRRRSRSRPGGPPGPRASAGGRRRGEPARSWPPAIVPIPKGRCANRASTARRVRHVPLGRGRARLPARRGARALPHQGEHALAVRPAAAAPRAHLALRRRRGPARAADGDPLHRRQAALRPDAQLRLLADRPLVALFAVGPAVVDRSENGIEPWGCLGGVVVGWGIIACAPLVRGGVERTTLDLARGAARGADRARASSGGSRAASGSPMSARPVGPQRSARRRSPSLNLVAVVGFADRYRRLGEDLDRWLALGSTLTLFASLDFSSSRSSRCGT